jgi:hypothetical protein
LRSTPYKQEIDPRWKVDSIEKEAWKDQFFSKQLGFGFQPLYTLSSNLKDPWGKSSIKM